MVNLLLTQFDLDPTVSKKLLQKNYLLYPIKHYLLHSIIWFETQDQQSPNRAIFPCLWWPISKNPPVFREWAISIGPTQMLAGDTNKTFQVCLWWPNFSFRWPTQRVKTVLALRLSPSPSTNQDCRYTLIKNIFSFPFGPKGEYLSLEAIIF